MSNKLIGSIGIDINAVRKNVSELGRILKSVPEIDVGAEKELLKLEAIVTQLEKVKKASTQAGSGGG